MNSCLRNHGIYRSREGILLGVCKGLADHFGLSVFWTRTILVVMFICSGFWPVIGLYLVAALLMKPEPVRPIETEEEQEFYDTYANSPRGAAQRLKRKYENLEKRIRRMEDTVTGRDYEWERKFNA